MRQMLILILALGWATSTMAAQTYKVPIAIAPGSATLRMPDGTTIPISVPFSQFGTNACGSGTFSVELVNSGIEAQLDGSSPSNSGGCTFQFVLKFDVDLVVPELGGTSTLTWIDLAPVDSNFSSVADASASWDSKDGNGVGSTSSMPGGRFDTRWLSRSVSITPTGPVFDRSDVANPVALIPGDSMRIPSEVAFTFTTGTTGSLRVRFQYLIKVPEPSASLSLPLGMAWLAGLSMMRGGA